MLPLAATLSCSRVLTEEQEDSPIAFTSAVTVKAPVETAGDLDGTSGFAVWATHQGAEPAALADLLMDGVQVYRSGNEWAYDRVRMWQEGQWHFEAFYPYPETLAPETGQTGRDVLSTGLHFSKDGSQSASPEGVYIDYYYSPAASHDLMTASADRNYPSGGSGEVAFTFEHLLARVSIAVQTGASGLYVQSLEFSGMSILGAYNHTDAYAGRWQTLTSASLPPSFPASEPLTGTFRADLTGVTFPLTPNDPVTLIPDLLLIPQTPGNAAAGESPSTLTVTYRIGQGDWETRSADIPSTTAWESGHHYRYTLTLGTADVGLEVEVANWTVKDYTVEYI